MDGHRKADIELDKLLVNPENYRFETVKDQQEAMLIMLRSQKDKILKLARDVAQRGLNPTRRLVVKEADGGKYIILESNRRITVLKRIERIQVQKEQRLTLAEIREKLLRERA